MSFVTLGRQWLPLAYLVHAVRNVVKDQVEQAFVAEAVAIGHDVRMAQHGTGLDLSLGELFV